MRIAVVNMLSTGNTNEIDIFYLQPSSVYISNIRSYDSLRYTLPNHIDNLKVDKTKSTLKKYRQKVWASIEISEGNHRVFLSCMMDGTIKYMGGYYQYDEGLIKDILQILPLEVLRIIMKIKSTPFYMIAEEIAKIKSK